MTTIVIVLFLTFLGAILFFLSFGKIFNDSKKRNLKYFIETIQKEYSKNFNDGLTKDNALTKQLDQFRGHPQIYQFLSKITLLIIQAGSDLTLISFFSYGAASFIFSLFILLVIIKKMTGVILILASLASAAPYFYLRHQATKRKTILEEQLPLALDFMSRGLRAGHALTISINMAGKELPDPIGLELRKTYDEINYGIPFNTAMQNLSLRVNSQDYNFLVISLSIQRETGGNLTELLANLSKTIRERIKLAGKVRTLSAESKFSGVMLLIMPFLMGFILFLISPNYISVLWTTEKGLNMISMGILFMVIGAIWMSRIIKIKV